ncbi:MAG: MotA/TolQ/ExbB proton channel family protein [Victivallales bacterium]
MVYLTQALSWISTSLLLPVIVLLLAAFLYSLALLGEFFSLYIRLLKGHRNLKKIMAGIDGIDDFDFSNMPPCSFSGKLKKLIALDWHPVHCEKYIADCHTAYARELERLKFTLKIGPMLGLMGTLIPMGPALVGLAGGNIASMAYNMQMAFATTVVGIFIGAVGLITFSVKKLWYSEEIANLQYVLDLQLFKRAEEEE